MWNDFCAVFACDKRGVAPVAECSSLLLAILLTARMMETGAGCESNLPSSYVTKGVLSCRTQVSHVYDKTGAGLLSHLSSLCPAKAVCSCVERSCPLCHSIVVCIAEQCE